jgi:hypothetical protein
MLIRRFLAATLVALLVSVLGSVAPQQAAAASDSPITIAITGVIDSIEDPANVLGGAFKPGDTITGSYTYNAALNDSNADPNAGDYWHTTAPYGISLHVGGRVVETNPHDVGLMLWIQNNTDGRDVYFVRSYRNRPLFNGMYVHTIDWLLGDPTQTVLNNDSLPRSAPKLDKWQQSSYALVVGGGDSTIPWEGNLFLIRGHVTQAQKMTK